MPFSFLKLIGKKTEGGKAVVKKAGVLTRAGAFISIL